MRNIFIYSVLYYLRFFAQVALKIHRPIVIGITGSVGKSSARNAIYAVLKDYFPTKVISKGNSETGVPLGILGLYLTNFSITEWVRMILLAPFRIFNLKGVQYLIVEMGIDEPFPPKNMGYLLTIVKPDIAVFLNVHPAHTQQFDVLFPKDLKGEERHTAILEAIAKEKGRIITESGCKLAVYSHDNGMVRKVIDPFVATHHLESVTFGRSDNSDAFFANYQASSHGTKIDIIVHKQLIKLSLQEYVLPEEYGEIFAVASLIGDYLGLSIEQIQKGLQTNFNLPKSRSTLLKGIHDSIIIDSSYNASKAAVLAFLKLGERIKKEERRQFVFVFGDMRELGLESEQEHTEVADFLVTSVDVLVCVGQQTQKYVLPRVQHKVHTMMWFKTSQEAGEYLRHTLPHYSLVLVKGSQNTIFLEEAIKPILKNPQDATKLCRQEHFWMKKKRR